MLVILDTIEEHSQAYNHQKQNMSPIMMQKYIKKKIQIFDNETWHLSTKPLHKTALRDINYKKL